MQGQFYYKKQDKKQPSVELSPTFVWLQDHRSAFQDET